MIVDIHGGPESQARPGFQGRQTYLMDELGVALIEPNVRGSTGYGKSFTKLDNGRAGWTRCATSARCSTGSPRSPSWTHRA